MKKVLIVLFIISIFGFINGQILFFEDDLNNGADNWTIVNGAATNQWFFGNAAIANNTGSLYISDAAIGTINPPHSYNATAGSRVHVYTDLPPFPQNAINITLTFDAICGGEGFDELSSDYFKVYLQPITFTPIALSGNIWGQESTAIDETRENQIGAVTYNQFSSTSPTSPTSWTRISIYIPAEMAAGQTKRLVFTWRNDTSTQVPPPVGIDNISITYTELSNEPPNAVVVSPLLRATNVFIQENLQWRASPEGAVPTGYKLYFGTTNPPNFIGDLGLVTSWYPIPVLVWNQQYYWQVIPYNDFGDAINCPIWTFTTRQDPTISSFPYFENFDSYQHGQMPDNWSSVFGAPFNRALIIGVNNGGAYSPPNNFRIWSGYGNIFPNILARTPPIQDLNTKRIRFYTKGDTRTSLIIGYLTNPLDTNTFVPLETINFPTTNYLTDEIFVPFGNATGDFVAFKHGGYERTNVYIDDLTIEELPDSAEFYCTINSISFGFFSEGETATVSVKVSNLGVQPLIINQDLPDEIESAISNPIIIGSGLSETIVYTLTPTEVGAYTGTIIMNTNDTNNLQHVISASANVLPSGLIFVGSGNQHIDARLPVNMYYRTGYTQTIYLGEEIGATGSNLSSIYYYYNGHGANPNNIHQREWRIWMANTNQTEINSVQEFLPLNEMIEVFNGTVDFVPGEEGWFEIVFNNPFPYIPGSNLCIATFKSANPHLNGDINAGFYATMTPGQNRSFSWSSLNLWHGFDENVHPPVPNGTASTYIANIALNIPEAEPEAYIFTQNAIHFASITQYEESTRELLISNLGNFPLTISSITTPDFVTINESSIIIPHETSQALEVTITPLYLGTFSGVIVINSNAPNSPVRNVTITASVYPQGVIYIGDENSDLNTFEIPITYYSRNSIAQTIYLEQEMNTRGNVMLTNLSYKFTGVGDIASDRIVSVYMATTTENQFTSPYSWIPFEQFTLVYEGTLPVEYPGTREIDIELDSPFEYIGGNLVIMTHKHLTANRDLAGNTWQYTAGSINRTIYRYSDHDTYNIENVEEIYGYTTTFRPNTKILKEDETYPRPRNLVATVVDGCVTLSWDPPNIQNIARLSQDDDNTMLFNKHDKISILGKIDEGNERIALSKDSKQITQMINRNLISYNIYKNGTEYTTLPSNILSYEDTQVMNGIAYTYWVTAVYTEGESNPSNDVEVIPTGLILHPPANLSYTIQNERNVNLQWTFGLYVVNESFEGWGLSEDWHDFDQDGDGHSWEFATGGNMEGYQHIMSRSRTIFGDALSPQNWLISESFTPTANTYLNYWIGAQSSQLFAESYSIRVSQNSTNIENFNDSIFAETLSTGTWERRSINLSNYSGQTIRIAFLHHTQGGQSALKLDGVQVIRPVGVANQGLIGFNIYRNNDLLQSVVGTTFNFTDTNVLIGDNFYYVKANYGVHGESFLGNAFSVNMTSEIDDISEYTTKLIGNYPNPFNPETTIKFSLEKESFVTLDIFNIKGQKVTTIANDLYKTGDHSIIWKGNDRYGKPVSSGVYFYLMKTEEESFLKRMMLMK